MKTFLPPLDAQEEQYYLSLLAGGDGAARDILIERNMRLVAHIAKKYQNAEEDMEELISIGTIGLIKAVNTYKGNRGSRLGTYAARCIEKPILSLMRFYVLKRFPFTDQSRTGGYLPNILMKST